MERLKINRGSHRLTKYPRLYERTYWANGGYSDIELGSEMKIARNRDMIAERYGLKELIEIPRRYKREVYVFDKERYERRRRELEGERFMPYTARQRERIIEEEKRRDIENYDSFIWGRDHIEYYRTRGGDIVSIFSVYGEPTEYESRCIRESGYEMIEPIYTLNACSYVKLIERREPFR